MNWIEVTSVEKLVSPLLDVARNLESRFSCRIQATYILAGSSAAMADYAVKKASNG